MTTLACAASALEYLLHFKEHGIRIVGFGVDRGGELLLLQLEGENLPVGRVKAIYQDRIDDGVRRTVLTALEPAP